VEGRPADFDLPGESGVASDDASGGKWESALDRSASGMARQRCQRARLADHVEGEGTPRVQENRVTQCAVAGSLRISPNQGGAGCKPTARGGREESAQRTEAGGTPTR